MRNDHILSASAGSVSIPGFPRSPLAASPNAARGNQAAFPDSIGEAPAAADIATLLVSNDDAGFVSFQVVFRGKPASDLTVAAYLDTDRKAATGDKRIFGADYEVVLWHLSGYGSDFSLRRWTGKAFEEFYSNPPDVQLTAGVLTFAFDAADLGKTSGFNFAVVTKRRSTATLDRAPNPGEAPWSFKIKVAPVRLSVVKFKTAPTEPRAGHTFVASMGLKPSAPVASLGSRIDGPDCRATVAGKPLVELSSNMNESAGSRVVTALCTSRIPSDGSGKPLRGSVTAIFRGKPLTRTFSATISS